MFSLKQLQCVSRWYLCSHQDVAWHQKKTPFRQEKAAGCRHGFTALPVANSGDEEIRVAGCEDRKQICVGINVPVADERRRAFASSKSLSESIHDKSVQSVVESRKYGRAISVLLHSDTGRRYLRNLRTLPVSTRNDQRPYRSKCTAFPLSVRSGWRRKQESTSAGARGERAACLFIDEHLQVMLWQPGQQCGIVVFHADVSSKRRLTLSLQKWRTEKVSRKNVGKTAGSGTAKTKYKLYCRDFTSSVMMCRILAFTCDAPVIFWQAGQPE